LLVIPAEAGFSTAELVIQLFKQTMQQNWIPACAGMTSKEPELPDSSFRRKPESSSSSTMQQELDPGLRRDDEQRV